MTLRHTLIAAFALAAATSSFAQDAHHPADAKVAAKQAQPQQMDMGRMQNMMKRMQEQMTQMQAATDPQEKERLMQEHVKAMGESMAMTCGMMGGNPGK